MVLQKFNLHLFFLKKYTNIYNPMKKEPDKIIEYRISTPLKQTNIIGVISFVLSIIGLFSSFLFPFAIQIIGIILGHIAKSEINANPENYNGKGLVIVGLIINYLVIIFSLLFVLIFGASIALLLNLIIK